MTLKSAGIRRTKIVATLGPAWEEPARMGALLDAGVDVVRINASHGTPQIRERWVRDLREVMAGRDAAAALLLDLQGPRIRVGDLPAPLRLEPGQRVVFAPAAVARDGEIPTTYDRLARDAHAGSKILLDDGLISVEVVGIEGDRVAGIVVYGGELRSHKGMNLPGLEVSAPALTDKDLEDVAQGIRLGVDYIALSFVRKAEDVEQLCRLVPKPIKVIAKIEKDTAVQNMRAILEVADGVMVARGDLGVELPFEEVPLVQKRLIREANLQGKVVITATQMLESMVHAPRPTRAEISDVANAILDGTDAVMLSAETAVGKFPLEAVRTMDRIAREMEKQRRGRGPAFEAAVGRRGDAEDGARVPPAIRLGGVRTEDAIAVAVCAAADLLGAPLIVCFTSSGFTARKVAMYRPTVPIFAVTPNPETYRQLALVWGVVPVLTDHSTDYDQMLAVARERILARELASPGDRLVVTAGVPFDIPGTTNLLKIETV
ncbi:MAG TPA: pyruvate kinase [Gemmatimonadales bacterium]|nr:pyruvate kinase [Gemmatimonadales bacterium]